VIASYVHDASARRSGPMVRVNLAAIPENMMSELFGSVRGAFTDSKRDRRAISRAPRRTLLLDSSASSRWSCSPNSSGARGTPILSRRQRRERRMNVRTRGDQPQPKEMIARGSSRDLSNRWRPWSFGSLHLQRQSDIERLRAFCSTFRRVRDRKPSHARWSRGAAHVPWPGNVRSSATPSSEHDALRNG